MNAIMKRRMTGRLMVVGAGLALALGASDARADRVRVAASLPGVAFDFGRGHAAVAIGTRDFCNHEPRQIWHEPVYEWREVWVDVPAVVEYRRVAEYGSCGRRIGHRTVEVVIEPARRELRRERVLVRDGYYETVYDGHCGRRGCSAAVRVACGDRDIVISKAPKARHVHRAIRRAHRAAVRHAIRPHRRGIHVRVGR